MARFQMEDWLRRRGFSHGTDNQNWWSWPDGLIYFALDVLHEGQECVIYEYREEFPPRLAVGERKVYTREQYEADTGDTTGEASECWGHSWVEYHFPWPKTRAQAEAMADEMGWNNVGLEPKDTPMDEFIAGVDELLKPAEE